MDLFKDTVKRSEESDGHWEINTVIGSVDKMDVGKVDNFPYGE